MFEIFIEYTNFYLCIELNTYLYKYKLLQVFEPEHHEIHKLHIYKSYEATSGDILRSLSNDQAFEL